MDNRNFCSLLERGGVPRGIRCCPALWLKGGLAEAPAFGGSPWVLHGSDHAFGSLTFLSTERQTLFQVEVTD